MKRIRMRKSMGVSKKRRTKKRSLMKRVDKKIQKALNKTTEYSLKAVTAAALGIVPLASTSDTSLPVLNYTTLSFDWPVQGTGGVGQANRVGNSLKMCTTYFTLELRLFLNNGPTAANQISSIGYRIILFTTAETLNTAAAVQNFFQFNRNATGITSMINPTNKATIIVLYDKVFHTPTNPNVTSAQGSNQVNIRKFIRYSRKFKEVLFATNADSSPKKQTQYTYMAIFSDGLYSTTAQVGDVHYVTRYYWID